MKPVLRMCVSAVKDTITGRSPVRVSICVLATTRRIAHVVAKQAERTK